MTTPSRPPREHRLACLGFGSAETDAAGRLLALLGKHLKHPWRLAETGEDADMALVNVDADVDADVGADAGRRDSVAYCARKPSEHRHGTLHFPLRSYELLNLLNSAAPAGVRDPAPGTEMHSSSRYRLRAWPLESNAWTRERWRLMAAIRHRCLSIEGLVAQTGIAAEHVRQCLDDLDRLGALERNAASAGIDAGVATAPAGWRELAARIGQLLGFAR